MHRGRRRKRGPSKLKLPSNHPAPKEVRSEARSEPRVYYYVARFTTMSLPWASYLGWMILLLESWVSVCMPVRISYVTDTIEVVMSSFGQGLAILILEHNSGFSG